MTYQRFLTNKDYRAVLTNEQFSMLVNGDENRLSQAERSAEMNFLEYLDQHYEIEKVLNVGKSIREYSSFVTYPANVYFKMDGLIYKTLKSVNGCKKPDTLVYWDRCEEVVNEKDETNKGKYSQLRTYCAGDVVWFGSEWWVCKIPNGYDIDRIQIPGITPWKKVNVVNWRPNMEWEANQVCSYNSKFYVRGEDNPIDTEEVLTPETDDLWLLIGDYTTEYNYSVDKHDYVVYDSSVFEPSVNPNADKISNGENVILNDPRNPNVITHMVNIACYYLHQMISPTNISETRRWAYEDSMSWLSNAARFKINPKLPRKHDEETGGDVVDFALETYQKEFDPHNDMWLI